MKHNKKTIHNQKNNAVRERMKKKDDEMTKRVRTKTTAMKERSSYFVLSGGSFDRRGRRRNTNTRKEKWQQIKKRIQNKSTYGIANNIILTERARLKKGTAKANSHCTTLRRQKRKETPTESRHKKERNMKERK